MIYISRKENFNAAHRLYNDKWSPEKNREVFGLCANPHYHGHNFELIVTIKGVPDPETGCVMDLKVLSKIIQTEIVERVDHKNLSVDVDFMEGKMASCEILVMEFWKLLQPAIESAAPNARLHYIKLVETPKNYVEYYGESLT